MSLRERACPRLPAAGPRAALLAAALAAGCGGTGEVSGTVTFDGTPLEAGRVTFFDPSREGRNVAASIQPDGSYRIPFCPTGRLTATVQAMPRRLRPGEAPPPGTPVRGRYVGGVPPVPARYSDPTTSDLVVRVGRGTQTIDLALTP